MEGRPRFLGRNSRSSGLVFDEGSLFSESDWLTPGSTSVPLENEEDPLSNPEELASSGAWGSSVLLVSDGAAGDSESGRNLRGGPTILRGRFREVDAGDDEEQEGGGVK